MKRVLVIDDDREIREVIAEVLEGEGYDVAQARDGLEGLREAREHRTSLIVLDLMMPGMSGWEFRRAQKQDAALADIPVIVISAVLPEKLALLGDVAARLPKPFDFATFMEVVERHIARLDPSPV